MEKKKIQKIMNIFKKYRYYSGGWHSVDCSFIACDCGYCGCRTTKNREKIINNLTSVK